MNIDCRYISYLLAFLTVRCGRPFFTYFMEVNLLPSQAVLEQKKATVAALQEKISNSCSGVVVNYEGISVADDTKLRKELREAGVYYAVVKNTLLGYAAENTGLGELKDVLHGTTAIAISSEDDYTSAAKILSKYAEDSKGAFTIKAGYCDGNVIDVAGVDKLAKMPNKEGLLCMLCYALNGNISGLARALQAVVDKNGEGESAEA